MSDVMPSQRITLRISESLVRRLKNHAAVTDRSKSALPGRTQARFPDHPVSALDPGATIPAMKRALLLFLLIPFLAAQTATEVEITAEPSHHLALENEYVRVFKVEVAPRASTLMHRHRHDYVFVTLGDAHVSNEVEGKPPADLKFTDGETHFVPGNFAHVARNLSDQPFCNVTIELMQAEVNLEPDAVVPSHHHDGPHLVVAITDLDLRSDVEGMSPMPGKFKSGDIKWLPGGYSHTLTNVGKSPARFVTVEF